MGNKSAALIAKGIGSDDFRLCLREKNKSGFEPMMGTVREIKMYLEDKAARNCWDIMNHERRKQITCYILRHLMECKAHSLYTRALMWTFKRLLWNCQAPFYKMLYNEDVVLFL